MRNAINALSDFTQRLNADGFPESICLHCFATVHPLANSNDVRLSQAAHHCWQKEDAGPKIALSLN
jgi:hypothetical protein